MNFKKILAIILAAILCVSLLTSCDISSIFDGFSAESTAPSTSESESETGNNSESNNNNNNSNNSNNSNNNSNNTTTERFDYFNNDMTKYIAIDKSSYNNFSVTLEKMFESSEEGVKAYIDMLCKEYSSATGNKITDRAVVEGDVVGIYYKGYKDGVAFSGGSNMDDAKPYELGIGSGQFIPGFEEGLIGIIPAETSKDNLVSLNLTFPENYGNAELAGQAVVFEVYIEYIVEYAPAEYTEDFITKTLEYSTTDADIKASFEKYLKDELIPSLRESEALNVIWEELFEQAVVKEYPQSELDYYYESYIDQYEYYMEYYKYFGYSFASLDEFVWAYLGLAEGTDWRAQTREQCEVDVLQNLLFHAIAQQEGIIITATDYQNSLNYYVEYYKQNGYNKTASEVEAEVGSRLIKEYALFEKVNELLFNACNVSFTSK